MPRPTYPVPNSPPPSFRSRASSRDRSNRPVNPDLVDAFDADGDDSDEDEDGSDDRQRLVRGNSTPSFRSENTAGRTAAGGETASQQQAAVAGGQPTVVAPTSSRVYGGGIQSDGVFSNLSAKPETGEGEKDEMPPVCFSSRLFRLHKTVRGQSTNDSRPTNKPRQTKPPLTGKQRSSLLVLAGPTKYSSTACPWARFSASPGTP